MDIILLEKIEKLGKIGDVVTVKNGFARNFLLPRNKALRATSENITYIEAEKSKYEAAYQEHVAAAKKEIKAFDNATVTIIRQASEDGRLYGSISAKEIANELSEISKVKISGSMLALKNNIREVGLTDVEVVLHADVKTTITVNVARTAEEAKAALVPTDIRKEEQSEPSNEDDAAMQTEENS